MEQICSKIKKKILQEKWSKKKAQVKRGGEERMGDEAEAPSSVFANKGIQRNSDSVVACELAGKMPQLNVGLMPKGICDKWKKKKHTKLQKAE